MLSTNCFIQASSRFFPFISRFWTPSFTTFVSSPGLDNGFAYWGMSPWHSQGIFNLFLLAPHTSGRVDKYLIQMSTWITWAALLLGSKSESYGLGKVCHCTHFAKCTWKGGLTTMKKKDTIQRHSQNWISIQQEKKKRGKESFNMWPVIDYTDSTNNTVIKLKRCL